MSAKTVTITLRGIHPEWVKEADALAEAMSTPGIPVTQTDVFRAAIARGLEELRKPRKRG